MDQRTAELEAKKVYQKSKKLLEEALGSIAGIGDGLKANKDELEKTIKDSIACLDKVEIADSPKDAYPGIIKEALDTVRNAAELIGDEDSEMSGVSDVAAFVAKAMALMYPVSKLEEGTSRVPASPYQSEGAPSPFDDRRATKRMAIEADIGFQSETNFFMGFAEDISTGGLFISTFDIREIGSSIAVNFTLPNGHLVSTVGIVRWIREYNEMIPDTQPGMGIQFESLDENDKEIIHQFIEKRQPIFYDD